MEGGVGQAENCSCCKSHWRDQVISVNVFKTNRQTVGDGFSYVIVLLMVMLIIASRVEPGIQALASFFQYFDTEQV